MMPTAVQASGDQQPSIADAVSQETSRGTSKIRSGANHAPRAAIANDGRAVRALAGANQ